MKGRGLGSPGRRAALRSGAAVVVAAMVAPAIAETVRVPRRVTGAIGGSDSRFVIGCDGGGITSLRYRGDGYDTDYVRAGAQLGRIEAVVRRGDGAWQTLDSGSGNTRRNGERGIATTLEQDGSRLETALAVEGNGRDEVLVWRITVANEGPGFLEVGDLLLPLPMHTRFEGGRPQTEAVLKHSFVSGHGSHIFWMRANSAGPYLLLLPDRDTSLEFWANRKMNGDTEETWCAFVHAAASVASPQQRERWRQPVTTLVLKPGETRTYMFRFVWVADYDAARVAIAAAGGVDVEVVPGMTVPSDLHVDLALRSADRVRRIEPEYPDTRIERLPSRNGRQLFRIRFGRLGENRLTLHQGGGRRTQLEFFATEPVETMIAKRAAFIARCQHRDPAKWYAGLFGEWNMATQTLLGPDNYDLIKGWRIYEVTCDDPGLSKPAYLATKNAEHPEPAEVAALDLYIEKFVWGGLQKTTTEDHPYGIYGIPDWKQNRESVDPGPKGKLHIWRPYDYPHIFAMYLAMHRIARDHPAVPTKLTAREYLLRAHGTAVAMFRVPMRTVGWSADRTGFYNECVIPELIDALEIDGLQQEAATLRAHWAAKVRWFVQDGADLFGSEYAFDSTGFESTQAFARSALDKPEEMGVTLAQAEAFAGRQIAANLFCRGWLEPAYYYLGSDYRGTAGDAYTLTYMAQMGGGAVLDHALRDTADPYALLRLGYASQLSAWALLNSGSAESGYGYWYPGQGNDGAAAGGFEPALSGTTWLGQPHNRGAWYYSCEIDLGFCGAMRAARTILADDPLFGRICLGGSIRAVPGGTALIPRDGVRRRLSVRMERSGIDLELIDGRVAGGKEIIVTDNLDQIMIPVESFQAGAMRIAVMLRRVGGMPKLKKILIVNGCITFNSEDFLG